MEQPFQLGCYFYVPIRDVTSNHNNPEFNQIFRVNKLVARTFIANPNHYNEVKHINGILTDNRIENLEWMPEIINYIDNPDDDNT